MYKTFLWIALGGAVGAVIRFTISQWMNQAFANRYMIGTLVVNVLGCFLMGCVLAYLSSRPVINEVVRSFIAVGLLGAMTTFSTFSLETLQYLQRGDSMMAMLNIGLSVILGLLAVMAGFYLLRNVF